LIKWGWQNDKQRYFCNNCGKLLTTASRKKSIARQISWFKKWVYDKRTLKSLSAESKKSISVLRRLFSEFLSKPPTYRIKKNSSCHLIIDGTNYGDDCILNYFDNDLKYLQSGNIVNRENYDNYVVDLKLLKQSGLNMDSITSDGQKGLIKAINEVFPNVVHQRCIIHIQRMSKIYLTRNPKTDAGITLLYWVKKLHEIETPEQKNKWIGQFAGWQKKYRDFLMEKSESPSGRKWYTHKMLRRTRPLIKNALPNMFHYLDNSDIPKSTNGLEAKFSYFKLNLNIHRGLSKKSRKNFILWYYYFKYND